MGMTHSKAYIKVGSRLLQTLPGAKIDLGGPVRAPVVGDHKVIGYSETLKPSLIECEISLTQGMSLAEIQAIKDGTATYEADTGQTYSVANCFVTEALQLTAGEGGKVAVKISGDPAQELVS